MAHTKPYGRAEVSSKITYKPRGGTEVFPFPLLYSPAWRAILPEE